jgi:hypothetical protein
MSVAATLAILFWHAAIKTLPAWTGYIIMVPAMLVSLFALVGIARIVEWAWRSQ